MGRFQRKKTALSKFKKKHFKKRKSHTAKLLDSKINTAAEFAAKRIAQNEILKAQDKLVYRQYLFGAFTEATGTFSTGTAISWSGLVAPIAQIQKVDAVSLVKVIVTANPLQTPSTWLDPGTNVVAPSVALDGFRRNTTVQVYGISIGIRAFCQRIEPDEVAGFVEYPLVTVFWKLCYCNYDGMDAIANKPAANRLLQMPRSVSFGYSNRLDRTAEHLTLRIKTSTIAEGKFNLSRNRNRASVRSLNRYISLKDKNLVIRYKDLDQNGQTVERNKPFLVIRTSTPDGAAYIESTPLINAYTKLHYTDN